jgi:predicted metal-dependent peptidase
MPAGLSATQGELLQLQVAADVKDYAGKHPGSVPAGFLRWAESILQAPPIPWQEMVAAKIRYACDKRKGGMPSYDRPSRRSSTLILPVHRTPVPNIIIIADTSGSMADSDIGKALGVVADACLALGRCRVISCDAAASDPVDVQNVEDLREALRGGGGTDMDEGIQRAAELNPDAIVVVTDGYTPWPHEEPEAPVTIILTQSGAQGTTPKWAEVVEAFDGAEKEDYEC